MYVRVCIISSKNCWKYEHGQSRESKMKDLTGTSMLKALTLPWYCKGNQSGGNWSPGPHT